MRLKLFGMCSVAVFGGFEIELGVVWGVLSRF